MDEEKLVLNSDPKVAVFNFCKDKSIFYRIRKLVRLIIKGEIEFGL